MIDAKHTPGPWAYSIKQNISTIETYNFPDEEKNKIIAHVFQGTDWNEHWHTVNLITRAPLMFQSLIDIVRLLESPNDNTASVRAIAKNAILVALGETDD